MSTLILTFILLLGLPLLGGAFCLAIYMDSKSDD